MKFLFQLAEVLEPIQQLTCKVVPWQWQHEHDMALKKVKDLVTQAPLLSINMKQTMTATEQEHHQTKGLMSRTLLEVGTDLNTIDGQEYLLAVDLFSSFQEIGHLHDTKVSTVIEKLKFQFGRHGNLDIVISDNGPLFVRNSATLPTNGVLSIDQGVWGTKRQTEGRSSC